MYNACDLSELLGRSDQSVNRVAARDIYKSRGDQESGINERLC